MTVANTSAVSALRELLDSRVEWVESALCSSGSASDAFGLATETICEAICDVHFIAHVRHPSSGEEGAGEGVNGEEKEAGHMIHETAAVENIDREEVRQVVAKWMERVKEIVERVGGQRLNKVKTGSELTQVLEAVDLLFSYVPCPSNPTVVLSFSLLLFFSTSLAASHFSFRASSSSSSSLQSSLPPYSCCLFLLTISLLPVLLSSFFFFLSRACFRSRRGCSWSDADDTNEKLTLAVTRLFDDDGSRGGAYTTSRTLDSLLHPTIRKRAEEVAHEVIDAPFSTFLRGVASTLKGVTREKQGDGSVGRMIWREDLSPKSEVPLSDAALLGKVTLIPCFSFSLGVFLSVHLDAL